MVETLEELTYDHEEDGVLVRKQLDRVILTQGAWATVMFLFQERDRESDTFRAPKLAVVRFKKLRGAYRKHLAFTLVNDEQARRLSETLAAWLPRMTTQQETDETDETDQESDAEAEAQSRERDDGGPGPGAFED
jgi:hypothetical protein